MQNHNDNTDNIVGADESTGNQSTDITTALRQAFELAGHFANTHAFSLTMSRRLDEFTSAEFRFTPLPTQAPKSSNFPKSFGNKPSSTAIGGVGPDIGRQ